MGVSDQAGTAVRLEGDRNPPQPGYVSALASQLKKAGCEVDFGPQARALYAFDASVFRQVPIGVVLPRNADDVEAALAACREHRAPVLGRGTGSSLAGQTVNEAVVFDFSKYMNSLVGLDPQRRQARVQPGVICDELRDAAGKHGLTFGPDPATHDHATLGGMIGNNSCGTHSVLAALYGQGARTSDNIDELEIVTYDGLRMRVGPTSGDELGRIIAGGGRRAEIYAGLKRIADTYGDAIRKGLPDIPRRVSGYNIDELLPEKGFNVARALVGSEGTCALVLEATTALVHSPPERSLVVLGYPDIPSSGYDVPWLMGFEPIGCEFTSRHVVDNLHAKGFGFGGEERLPAGNAWVLLEFGGDTKQEADAKAEELFRQLERRPDAPSRRLYESPEDETAIWEIRRHSAGTSRMPAGLGGHPGWPNWEDAAVPPDRLGDYLRDFTAQLDRYGYDGVFFGHWGQGCIHCRIDWDLRTAEGVRKFRRFMEEAADLVASYGGLVSGEHGDGHGRAELWPKIFSPELMQAFAEFKAVWDPAGRMNPHKLIDPYPLDSHLREGLGYRPLKLTTKFGYPEDGGFHEAAGRCFGVGKCRHLDGGVMCPSFMVTREEKHSTRGRARLLQEMAEAAGPVKDRWRSEEVKDALELCLACKGCKGDCPVKVDMATYKAEFLSHYYKGRLRPRQAYALGLIPVWARLASHAPEPVNFLSHAPLLNRMVKLAGGVAQRRDAPRFAARTFTAWFAGHTPRDPDAPPVLLWPDTFINYFEPDVGIAAVQVLESAGFRVTLPDRWVCCGRPLYDYGMLDMARRYLTRTLDVLRPQLEAGIPVIGLEPSCLAVFRDELVNMLPGNLDARRLAAQSYVLSEFLDGHAPGWTPPRLHRKALVQPHCHHHSVIGFDAETRLLAAMGLDVETPDAGCCGMAGSFGYEAGERYRVSMAAGERKLLPAIRDAADGTLIIADGFSCRGQIKAGTDRHGLHLAQVLQLAFTEGQLGPGASPPEAVYADGDRREPHRHVRRYVLAGAGALAAGAGLAAIRRAAHLPIAGRKTEEAKMSEERTASDVLVERLIDWGADTIFGLPGDGINGFMEALRKHPGKMRYIHVRHEEVAAMAAVGYAKFTGKLGVCFSTASPGAVHLINGLLDAKVEQAPVLAITGMTYHDLIGTSYLQDVNTDYLFNDVALYNQRIMGPQHVINVVDYAVRTSLTHRGPSHLAFPIDYQAMPAEGGSRFRRNVPGHTSAACRPPVRVPARQDLQAAAAALQGKTKVAILAGAGARGAGAELEAVAGKLSAPVIKALLGKDCLPDDSPYTTGAIALVGTRPSEEALEQCDALLIVGSTMPYIEFYPSPGQAVCVQIDDKPERIGLRCPVDVPLVGDARATLAELLPLLARNENRDFLAQAQDGMRDWWDLMAERGTSTDMPMKPQVPAWALNDVLADDAIICGDSGTVTTWAARQIKVRRGQRFSLSGTNCSMAAGLPYAIGAAAAYPGRQVVAFTGDGSLTMQLGDVLTAVQHDLPVKIVVIKNNSLGLIKWEQMVFLGNPEYGVDMAPLDFVKFAEAAGARGMRIEDPARCAGQLREAFSWDGPVIIECLVDQHEPPIPAKVKKHQVTAMAQALRQGTPNRNRIALQMVKDMLDESSFAASPGHVIPAKIGEAVSGIAGKLRDHANDEHPS